jgi:phosphatidylglycerol:prolipoprotein diacylglycerol transferase
MSLGEFFTGFGFLVGILVLIWSARSQGLITHGMGRVALAGAAGGIFGAKLAQLIFSGWPTRVPWWVLFDPKAGGKALFGGLIFGWVAVAITKHKLGITRSTGDHFALALPAGEAVGRIGCYFNQCCYGRACDLPWAVAQHGALRHPTQIYASIVAALAFVALLAIRSHLRRKGDLWRIYLAIFGATRFGLEFLRENGPAFLGLSAMQWLCLELCGFAIVSWRMAERRTPLQPRLEGQPL